MKTATNVLCFGQHLSNLSYFYLRTSDHIAPSGGFSKFKSSIKMIKSRTLKIFAEAAYLLKQFKVKSETSMRSSSSSKNPGPIKSTRLQKTSQRTVSFAGFKTFQNETCHHDVFLFSSESVGEGHPDKMCDQVNSITKCHRIFGIILWPQLHQYFLYMLRKANLNIPTCFCSSLKLAG